MLISVKRSFFLSKFNNLIYIVFLYKIMNYINQQIINMYSIIYKVLKTLKLHKNIY